MTFSEEQQQRARDLFIEECRQKAWGAACNADWIGKQQDELLAQFETASRASLRISSESLRKISFRILSDLTRLMTVGV
jgi:hypothetical protein